MRKARTVQCRLRAQLRFARFSLSLLWVSLLIAAPCSAAEVFLRFKVNAPAEERLRVVAGGYRHAGEPWGFPEVPTEVTGGAWSPWLNLSAWPWHARMNREGGIAEWPSLKLSAAQLGKNDGKPLQPSSFEVELADAPNDNAIVHHFTEKSESSAIGFLVPTPLREHASEFETGTQMGARHLAWAKEATAGHPVNLKKFDLITALWGHYDPALERQDLQTLHTLGFSIFGNAHADIVRAAGLRLYKQTDIYQPDPRKTDHAWDDFVRQSLKPALATDAGRAENAQVSHWVLADEVQTLDFRRIDASSLDGWFRDYLRAKGVTDAELGQTIDQVHYPAAAMFEKTLPRGADLATRKLMYHAAKFGQWWSARQLRHDSDLIHAALPGMKTETLPSDHGFLGAWGPPHLGMSYRMLDLFELGAQQATEQLSVEDWLGLNHMYGPGSTWTGGQTFAYFNAIMSSAIGDRPIAQRALITPSDDDFLRLKAYSAIGQGAKSIFFWTYGPTFIGTENYWSDLKSQYDGIAKLTRALAQAEDVLAEAHPVRDPVAILYSVSHDIWMPDNPAAFVEKRLLWHALRHLGVQPVFVREEDVEAGQLDRFKALYVVDWCISRKASAAIDRWVQNGNVVYLSAGAATRDEYAEPYVAPFAAGAWPDEASAQLHAENHSYNERTDLPTIKPMTSAKIKLAGSEFELPVIGCQQPLRAGAAGVFATFSNGAPAGVELNRGKGKVLTLGFCPMLAYGQLAGFKPRTMEEQWPAEPRSIVARALELAHVNEVARPSVPVVEASLLSGPSGGALVLCNYTYKPINSLTIDLRMDAAISKAISTEGSAVTMERTASGIRLRLPLKWTEIVVLGR